MIKQLIIIIFLGGCCLPGFAQNKGAKLVSNQNPPNIVILLADDLGYGDIGCFGNTKILTPHLDELAQKGLLLSDCYSSAPMCSPSRAGLLTGRIPNKTGVYDWIAPDSIHHLKTDELTIGELLKQAGYQTSHHGKWHLNGNMDGSQPLPSDHGFDYYFTTQYSAHHLSPTGFYQNGKKLYQQHGYSCDIVVKDALKYLHQRDESKPFFQYIAFHETHEPVAAPPEYIEQYCDAGKKAIYYGCVSNLDKAIGRYIDQLEKMNLAENTIIIFTSDNGPAAWNRGYFARSYGSAGDLKGRKRFLFEGGIRVPGIIYWPDHIQAAKSTTPVCNIDFLPTICELANVNLPTGKSIDGVSIVPLLKGENLQREKPLHWHFYAPMDGPNSVMRVDDWILSARWDGGEYSRGRFRAEYVNDMKSAQLTDFKLYNIVKDIHQDKDVAKKHPKQFNKMKKLLIKYHQEVKDESPLW